MVETAEMDSPSEGVFMTIAERQAREAYDRENPWRPMNTAVRGDGLICELLFNDLAGEFLKETSQYFLDHDGTWYRLDPPGKLYGHGLEAPAINWRPAYVRITPERRNVIRQRARP
ncbi:hypothetical protein [Mesorhizobium sp. CO1-1-9]|uniref:hypothetical protein n=1 Tax=Mesorhizobium sp. CO1-1-9 TaxID=2876630 RepID=UPI001CC91F7A|nr:hypothetical protein [Mesorhizobium sp. CO1-1-9]MBZ9693916.1 hypothetical protein [Mesorhizobium sp. CO1-1-9]